MEGLGPYQICSTLHNEKIETPGYYFKKQGIGHHKHREFKNPYYWNSSNIEQMLKSRSYCGDTVNFKTEKHFKDKKSKYVDESKWVIFENTHEPIISRELFENVQRIREKKKKKRPKGHNYIHPLAGLIHCKDCGNIHNIHRIYNGKDKPTAICSKYARGKQKMTYTTGVICPTSHRIDCGKLMEVVKHTLQTVTSYALENKADFEKLVKENLASQQTAEVKKKQSRMPIIKSRLTEIDTILMNLYEDKALGKIQERQYMTMYEKYSSELESLETEYEQLASTLEKYENGTDKANRFIKLIEKYAQFETLSATMLNELIDKIVIHEREIKSSILSPQQIDIHFVYIGELASLTQKEPTAEEQEQLAKELARRKIFQERYQKAKASGRQQEYDKKHRPRSQARKQAEKEKILAEDYVLGQNVLAV
jgi:hypothetical protein